MSDVQKVRQSVVNLLDFLTDERGGPRLCDGLRTTGCVIALGEIAHAVDRMDAAAPRWIPCSERMPEPGVKVLVVRRSSPEFAPSMYLSAHHPGRGYYVWQSAEIDFEADEVPCWMPLPPLPG